MEKHDLLHEFPELKDKIHELKTSNEHFRKLFDEYDQLDHQIYRNKMDIEVETDEVLKERKAHLLYLKDQIYSMLQH